MRSAVQPCSRAACKPQPLPLLCRSMTAGVSAQARRLAGQVAQAQVPGRKSYKSCRSCIQVRPRSGLVWSRPVSSLSLDNRPHSACLGPSTAHTPLSAFLTLLLLLPFLLCFAFLLRVRLSAVDCWSPSPVTSTPPLQPVRAAPFSPFGSTLRHILPPQHNNPLRYKRPIRSSNLPGPPVCPNNNTPAQRATQHKRLHRRSTL